MCTVQRPSAVGSKGGRTQFCSDSADQKVRQAVSNAKKAYAAGCYDEAVQLFTTAVSLGGDDALQLCNRSAALFGARNFEAAVRDAIRALALDPCSKKAYYRLASALEASGHHTLARAACDKGLVLSPCNSQLLSLRATAEARIRALDASSDQMVNFPHELLTECSALLEPNIGPGDDGSDSAIPPNQAGAGAASSAHSPANVEEDILQDDAAYCRWCHKTANALYAASEYGQAVAWYTRAIQAAEDMSRRRAQEAAAELSSDQQPDTCRFYSNRAAAFLSLERYSEALSDCKMALALNPTEQKASLRGVAASLQLGEMGCSVEMVRLAEQAASCELRDRESRLSSLSVGELRSRLREAKSDAAGTGSVLEKGELVRQVAEAEADGGLAPLLGRAAAEVAAMAQRVGEVEAMARRSSWDEALEHATWLAREYPHHRQLRALRLAALLALQRSGEAHQLCEELAEAHPDAADVLCARLELLLRHEGVETALAHAALNRPPPGAADREQFDELLVYLQTVDKTLSRAQSLLQQGDASPAVEVCCEGLVLAEAASPTRLSLMVLLAAALARLARHTEAVAVCDEALRMRVPMRDDRARTPSATPTLQEKLFLRRAGCFLALRQYAHAVADYRSAAALNPKSVNAAQGMQHAWTEMKKASIPTEQNAYMILGVAQDASAVEVRRAFHALCRRWHPDKCNHFDGQMRLQAAMHFEEAQGAFEKLRDAEARAAYDDSLLKEVG